MASILSKRAYILWCKFARPDSHVFHDPHHARSCLLRWNSTFTRASNGGINLPEQGTDSPSASTTLQDQELIDTFTVYSPLEQHMDLSSTMLELGAGGREAIDGLLGKGVMRATRVEAVVRMMADLFAIYDDRDTDFLNKELKYEFGEGDEIDSGESASSSSNMDEISHEKEEQNLVQYLNSMDDETEINKKLSSTFFGTADQTARWSVNDYIELQAGSRALRYQSHNANSASAALYKYLGTYHNDMLKGVGDKLLSSEGIPNLKTFNYLLRRLITFQHTKPAQIALDCLILSEIPLSSQTWSIGIKVAIANGSMTDFLKLARLVDLSQAANKALTDSKNGVLEKISSNKPAPWLSPESGDKNLRQRFFPSDQLYEGGMPLINVLIEGFYRFRLHSHLDTVLRYMMNNDMLLNPAILTLNFRAAATSRDSIRATWTWQRTKILLSFDSGLVDKHLIKAANSTAQRLKLMDIVEEIGNISQQMPKYSLKKSADSCKTQLQHSQ